MKDPNRRRQRSSSFAGDVGFAGSSSSSSSSSAAAATAGDVVIETWKGKPTSSVGVGGSDRRRAVVWCAVSVVLLCCLASAAAFSTFHLFGVSFRPVLGLSTWQRYSVLNAVSSAADLPGATATSSGGGHQRDHLHVRHAINFPDQLVLFLNQHPSQPPAQFPDPTSLRCFYYPPSSAVPNLDLPLISIDSPDALSLPYFLARCPLSPRGFSVTVGTSDSQLSKPIQQLRRWDFLTYASLLDRHDNSTIAFVKGLNLRPERLSDASRYECVFGWRFDKPKYLLTSEVLSVAQEVVRCKTPLSVLHRLAVGAAPMPTEWGNPQLPVLVSVKIKGRGGGIMPSVASPISIEPPPVSRLPKHRMCVCTMVRNQARFLKEWITYHARIGVQRWFIYDNDSNDNLEEVVSSMESEFNVTHHVWPWVKTQEAGFAHCALQSRSSCEWVGFIDVDEFLYLPQSPSSASNMLHDVLTNHSMNYPWVGELRTTCYSFGPSGRKTLPADGVTVGYTCRVGTPERHKSIVRPDVLSSSLINVVHHFHLRNGFTYVNMDRGVMVINHYKYQVWEVFKEKFYRRVATYVADWQDEENVGSKDRAPGLGTKAVEPVDWSSRFCDVSDTGLKDWVLSTFADPDSGLVPWS